MNFSMLKRTAAVSAIIVFSLLGTAHAELFVGGTGEFKSATQSASSTLNKAFSAFHTFMAAIDAEDTTSAETARAACARLLYESADAYANAKRYAGKRVLDPVVKSANEAKQVLYFFQNASRFGVPQNPSEMDIASGAIAAVRKFALQLSDVDIKKLISDLPAQQEISGEENALQEFLLSATTVIRIG